MKDIIRFVAFMVTWGILVGILIMFTASILFLFLGGLIMIYQSYGIFAAGGALFVSFCVCLTLLMD
jgi:hypothetical protein